MTKGEHIIELLKGVYTGTIWGMAIEQVVKVEGGYRIMDLVIDLRGQARDNPVIMRDILGDEVYDAIMAI